MYSAPGLLPGVLILADIRRHETGDISIVISQVGQLKFDNSLQS